MIDRFTMQEITLEEAVGFYEKLEKAIVLNDGMVLGFVKEVRNE